MVQNAQGRTVTDQNPIPLTLGEGGEKKAVPDGVPSSNRKEKSERGRLSSFLRMKTKGRERTKSASRPGR